MKPIPLPSQVHYELLLQLLERQSLRAADREPALQEQIQQLIVILRKAFAKQKQIEDICRQTRIPFEYHWSMHSEYPPNGKPSPPSPSLDAQGRSEKD
jgi:hypothetical protein